MNIDSPKVKRAINSLANEWIMAQLPTDNLVFRDYSTAISWLMIATRNTHQATKIVHAVIDQAIRLERSSEWVAAELHFETSAQVLGDRQLVLTMAIQSQGAGDDASLDLYNERLARFSPCWATVW